MFLVIIFGPKFKALRAGTKKPGLKVDGPLHITISGYILLIAFCVLLLASFVWYEFRPEHQYLHIFLMTLTNLGLLLWSQSMHYMGSLFADGIYESEKLITNGSFSLVRHPIYLSYIIFYLSIGIYCFSVVHAKHIIIQAIALLLFIGSGCVSINYRITQEEKVLFIFGADYIKYKNETPRLFPTLKSFKNFIKQPFRI